MTPAELLHTDAARYATNRKNAYVEAMKLKEVDHMSEKAHTLGMAKKGYTKNTQVSILNFEKSQKSKKHTISFSSIRLCVFRSFFLV